MLKYIVIGSIIGLTAIILAAMGIQFVPEGHVGILLTSGKADQNYVPPGLRFVTPFVQEIIFVDTRNIKTDVNIAAASKDLQSVTGTIAVNTKIAPEVAVKLYSTIGLAYQTTVIFPAVQESVKQVTAQFTASELLSKRDVVKTQVLQLVKDRLAKYDIVLLDLSIIDFDFSKSFNEAIEAKVTAAQTYEKALNDEKRIQVEANQTVAKAEGEQRAQIALAEAAKQQSILKAEGDAQSIELNAAAKKNQTILLAQGESQAIELIQEQLKKNPQYIEYIKANKWSGNLPSTLIDSNATSTLMALTPK